MSAAIASLTPEAEQRLLKNIVHVLLKGQIYNEFRLTGISLPTQIGGGQNSALQLIKNPLPGRLLMLIYNAGTGIVNLTDSPNGSAAIPIPANGNASDKWGPGIDWYVWTSTSASIVVAEFA